MLDLRGSRHKNFAIFLSKIFISLINTIPFLCMNADSPYPITV